MLALESPLAQLGGMHDGSFAHFRLRNMLQ
jgi:hypothetical protein